MAVHALTTEKARRKAWHDRGLRIRDFTIGELVLLYKTKVHKGKLKFTGEGPYPITDILSFGAVVLEYLDGKPFSTPVNGS